MSWLLCLGRNTSKHDDNTRSHLPKPNLCCKVSTSGREYSKKFQSECLKLMLKIADIQMTLTHSPISTGLISTVLIAFWDTQPCKNEIFKQPYHFVSYWPVHIAVFKEKTARIRLLFHQCFECFVSRFRQINLRGPNMASWVARFVTSYVIGCSYCGVPSKTFVTF